MPNAPLPRVVILGGGFGGLYAAKALGTAPVRVTVIDRRNFHLFQPLLYQVATGSLSPGDIASTLRAVLQRFARIEVLQAEVVDVDPHARRVLLRDGAVEYDMLIVATGSSHSYFGHDEWEPFAPGLKTIEDALKIRRDIFSAFERAELTTDPREQHALTTFVIVGGGPTGVELAGTLGELAHATLRQDFRHVDPRRSHILLVEALDRILPTYPSSLSARAARSLERLGVTVRTRTRVTDIADGQITLETGDATEQLETHNVLWAAGVQASSLGRVLGERVGVELDRAGRVRVQPDLTAPNYPEIF
ncbi:MAG: NAD(P)/FAD-dependent oxidoreductase, partial [Chloroflexi bacterium]|nr:NAD(P)/FAD-dependent oxidoreductase [Chloroflexota bacterium]